MFNFFITIIKGKDEIFAVPMLIPRCRCRDFRMVYQEHVHVKICRKHAPKTSSRPLFNLGK